MIEVLTKCEVLRELAKKSNKWAMYVSWGSWVGIPCLDEIVEAAPYLSSYQALADGEAFLFFDTREELDEAYGQTVGDDGSVTNSYGGPVRVYALTCNPQGDLETENT